MVIGGHVAILEDATNKLELDYIKNSSAFHASGCEIPNLRLAVLILVKFTIKNESDQDHLILHWSIQRLAPVTFYAVSDGTVRN